MGHHNPRAGASLYDLLLTALVLLSPCTAASQPASRNAAADVHRRTNPEHVVLADCRDSNGVVSSQMAYYTGQPDGHPKDVAQVVTPSGQSRLWAGNTTSALFTDTGTTFTAKLGPAVGANDYAGTGDNGYGPFTCWQRYYLNLYSYDGTTCSQVYDCDHEVAPASTAAASTPASATSAVASQTNKPDTDSGLSHGAETAIIAGVVCGVAIVAIIVGFILVRRVILKRRAQAGGTGGASTKGFRRLFGKSAPPVTPSDTVASQFTFDPVKKYDAQPAPVYELDGQWRGNEIEGIPRGELDGTQRNELDAKETAGQMYRQRHGG